MKALIFDWEISNLKIAVALDRQKVKSSKSFSEKRVFLVTMTGFFLYSEGKTCDMSHTFDPKKRK